jgi:hypothetical protein
MVGMAKPLSPPKVLFLKSPIKKLIKKSSLANKASKSTLLSKSALLDHQIKLLNGYQTVTQRENSSQNECTESLFINDTSLFLPSITTNILLEKKKPSNEDILKLSRESNSPKLQRKNTLIIEKNFMRHSQDQSNYVIAVEDYLPDPSENTKLTVRVGELFKIIDKEKGKTVFFSRFFFSQDFFGFFIEFSFQNKQKIK